jgi:DNA-binding NarL/FixJ family response regulator
MEKKYKVIIVDDHDMFRAGVIVLLGKSPKVEIIGQASNGAEFLKLLDSLAPDVVLMDISMPVLNGIEATHQAIKLNPNIKILALSMFGEEEYYYKMVEAGVKGFVLKSSGIHELEYAIEEVAMGSSFFSGELLRQVVSNIKDSKSDSSELGLSEEDRKILSFFAKNLSAEEIASELDVSAAKVEELRLQLLQKTGCNNTAALAMFAIKNKVVSL